MTLARTPFAYGAIADRLDFRWNRHPVRLNFGQSQKARSALDPPWYEWLSGCEYGLREARDVGAYGVRAASDDRSFCVVITRNSGSAPNAITLSCKSRPPCRPPTDGAAAAATNAQRQERNAADVTPAAQFEAARRRLRRRAARVNCD